MKKKLFVVLSHDLTAEQIADFDGEIILLKTISPEVANECANIDPNADIQSIQKLAAQVVTLAHLSEATHFCCQGEPGLQMWSNLFAAGKMSYVEYNNETEVFYNESYGSQVANYITLSENLEISPNMTCITSTTQRQSTEHVMWRELF